MNAHNQLYPRIIPNGTSGSTITLTGTYTNINGVSFALNSASTVVSYNPAAGTPVFTSGPAARCSGTSYVAAVTPVAGATGYTWTVPAGFTPTGKVTTTASTLTITPNAGVAGGFYSLECQALSGSCPPSATASVPLTINGGPQLRIVDSDPTQNYQGVVCQHNHIFLELVPVGPVMPGAINRPYTSIQWAASIPQASSFDPAPFPLQTNYSTVDAPSTAFTVTATYIDACNNRLTAVAYNATTSSAGSASLNNGYSCTPYRWRQAPRPHTPTQRRAPYNCPAIMGRWWCTINWESRCTACWPPAPSLALPWTRAPGPKDCTW